MRKPLLHLLLPLFMLLSQQGAVWHGIGHLAGPRGVPASQTVASAQGAHDHGQSAVDTDELTTEQLCELCLAFDDLAASARSEPPVLALAEAVHVQVPGVETASRPEPAPLARSRGPPALL